PYVSPPPPQLRPAPRSTLFPYTTLFRSRALRHKRRVLDGTGGIENVRQRQRLTDGHPAANTVVVLPRNVRGPAGVLPARVVVVQDRKSTRLNSSHVKISYAVFCLKTKRP